MLALEAAYEGYRLKGETMGVSRMKSFVVRSIVTVLLAMLVISAFPMWVFAERAEQGIQPSEETIRSLACSKGDRLLQYLY
jgi:hypothetical protein